MGHIQNTTNTVTASSHTTWENEENAKAEFFAMMAEERKRMATNLHMEGMEEMGMMDSGIDEVDFAPVPAPVQDEVEQDEDISSEDEEMQEERETLDNEFLGKLGEEEKDALRDSGFTVDVDENDPLAPYWDEELNICFKGFGGVQIDFAQRLGSEARNAVKVLFAQQKGKFPLTIQRMINGEGETEYEDIITIAPQKGQGSALKGASAGTSKRSTGKTPEQLAEDERKRKEREEAEERKRLARAAKAELRAKTKAAEELEAARKAARNAPEEGTLANMQFEMLHREQGATYGELGHASAIVNGGWKTTIRQFAKRFNKVILTQYRQCSAKPGIKTYATYKLIDNNNQALANIPNGWVIDPTA